MKNITTAHQLLALFVGGLLATLAMTLIGFWQAGIGLSAVDVGMMITNSMNATHAEPVYGLWAGNLIHFGNGVILAIIYVAFLQNHLPGNWLARGLAYGAILTLAATLIVVPLATEGGVFFLNTRAPGMMMLGSFIPHLFYGVALTLSLKVAALEPVREQIEVRREMGAPQPAHA